MSKWHHDCDECVGLFTEGGEDWYVCPRSLGGGSLIARYGDEGPEYWSAPLSILAERVLEGAMLRAYAMARGIN